MKRIPNAALFCLALAIGSTCSGAEPVSIADFGAVADGATLSTAAIQRAIDRAAEQGGRVVVPRGRFLTGSLVLKSGVELRLADGAVLLGSTDPDDYVVTPDRRGASRAALSRRWPLALLHAYGARDVSITGTGTIDGQGLELALEVDDRRYAGPGEPRRHAERLERPNERYRPKLTKFVGCENVTVRDVTIKNAACWCLTLERCAGVLLKDLTIDTQAYWNNDGIDLTDCRDALVTGCFVNSADDGICLKSYNRDSRCENIRVTDCRVRSSASAVKFGTASYGGFKDIVIDNIEVYDTYRSAIAIESVDGGHIENVRVSNITAKNTGNAIFLRLGHRDGEAPGTIKDGRIEDVDVEIPFGRPDLAYDLRARAPHSFHNPFPSSIVGIPGRRIENVVLENIRVSHPGRATRAQAYLPTHRLRLVPEKVDEYPEFSMFGELPAWGFYVRHAAGIRLKNVTLEVRDKDYRPAIVLDDVRGAHFEELDLPGDARGRLFISDDSLDVTVDEPPPPESGEPGERAKDRTRRR